MGGGCGKNNSKRFYLTLTALKNHPEYGEEKEIKIVKIPLKN